MRHDVLLGRIDDRGWDPAAPGPGLCQNPMQCKEMTTGGPAGGREGLEDRSTTQE
jgi:hypothetical protein